jgi:hypothetical protein
MSRRGLVVSPPPLHIEPSTLRDFASRILPNPTSESSPSHLILPRPGFSMGVRWFSVPNQKTKSSERKRLYRQRWFRHGQRWRTGCEGRISALKRRHGPVVLRIPRHAALGGIDCDRRFPLRGWQRPKSEPVHEPVAGLIRGCAGWRRGGEQIQVVTILPRSYRMWSAGWLILASRGQTIPRTSPTDRTAPVTCRRGIRTASLVPG